MEPKNLKSKEIFRAKKDEEQQEDIISNLPDDLLHQILSFVETNSAVQTCILSKRWTRVWATLPYLNLNFNGDFDPFFDYFNFVNKFLCNRNTSIDILTIRLTTITTISFFKENDTDDQLNDAISNCLLSSPCLKNLTLIGDYLHTYWVHNSVPLSFWNLQSLTTLHLERLDLPEDLPWSFPILTTLNLIHCTVPLMSWNLPGLISLYMDEVLCIGDKSLSFEDFVHLKTLTLKGRPMRCYCLDDMEDDIYSITCLNLTNLTISIPKTFWEHMNCRFLVSGPSLSYLEYNGPLEVLLFFVDGLPCLEKVNIDIDMERKRGAKIWNMIKKSYFQKLIRMFQEIRGVNFLTLPYSFIKVYFFDLSHTLLRLMY